MNLTRCTFTELDEEISLHDFSNLCLQYNFIEWGILYSTSENMTNTSRRYPSQKWFEHNIKEINNIAQKSKVSLALHVCGKEIINLIEQKSDF